MGSQNKVVPVDGFQPRELTAADKEHFKIYMTQHTITQYDSTPQPTGTFRTDVQPQGPVQSLLQSYQPTGVLRTDVQPGGPVQSLLQSSQPKSHITKGTVSVLLSFPLCQLGQNEMKCNENTRMDGVMESWLQKFFVCMWKGHLLLS